MGSIRTKLTTGKNKKPVKRFVAEAYRNAKRKSKSFDNKTQAKAWILEYEAGGRNTTCASDVLFREAMLRYRRDIDELYPKKSERSKDDERRRIKFYLDHWLADIPLVKLDNEHGKKLIRELRQTRISDREIKDSSIKRGMSVLHNVLKHCKATDWYDLPNPWTNLIPLETSPSRKRTIQQDEIEQILKCADYSVGDTPRNIDQWAAAYFMFSHETAMRLGEIGNIRNEWITHDRTYLVIPAKYVKTREQRNVPLTLKALEILDGLPPVEPGERLFLTKPTNTGKYFQQLRKKAGYPDGQNGGFTFHDMRHLAIMRLGKINCLNRGELQRMVGHKPPTMTALYTHADPRALAKGIRLHFELVGDNNELVDEAQALGVSVHELTRKSESADEVAALREQVKQLITLLGAASNNATPVDADAA